MINTVANLLVEGKVYKIRVMEDLFDVIDFGKLFAEDRFTLE